MYIDAKCCSFSIKRKVHIEKAFGILERAKLESHGGHAHDPNM